MIGYCHIPGLMVETASRIRLPAYGGLADIPPDDTYPAEEISLLLLAPIECSQSLISDHLPATAQGVIGFTLGSTTPYRQLFLRLASERPIAGTYQHAAADFLVTALRLYFGACIDSESWKCCFEPTEGPFHVARPDSIPWSVAEGRFEFFRTFHLTNEHIERLPAFLALLSVWRKTITTVPVLRIALRYLSRSMGYAQNVYQPAFEDHVLSATIALEALLSPSDNNELKFRIAQNAANFVGRTASEREETFSIVTAAYDLRSKVAHGTFAEFPERLLKRSSARDARDFTHKVRHVVRESFARMTALIVSGTEKRESALQKLEQLGRRSIDSIAGLPADSHYTCPHPAYDDPVAAGVPKLDEVSEQSSAS
jgi:hypothetical protein